MACKDSEVVFWSYMMFIVQSKRNLYNETARYSVIMKYRLNIKIYIIYAQVSIAPYVLQH